MIKRFHPAETSRSPLPSPGWGEIPHQNFLGAPARPSLATPVHKPSFGVRPGSQDLSQLQATLRQLRER